MGGKTHPSRQNGGVGTAHIVAVVAELCGERFHAVLLMKTENVPGRMWRFVLRYQRAAGDFPGGEVAVAVCRETVGDGVGPGEQREPGFGSIAVWNDDRHDSMIVVGVGDLREHDLLLAAHALGFLRGLACFLQCRQQHSGEDGDDGDHDKDNLSNILICSILAMTRRKAEGELGNESVDLCTSEQWEG